MKSVERNVVFSTLADLTNQLVRSGQQLIWVPLFLSAFGKKGYGEWLTLLSLAGYVAMADVGVQTFWLNLLTGAYVRKENDTYRRLFRNGLMLFLIAGSACLAGCVLLVTFGDIAGMLGIRIISSSDAAVVFFVLTCSTLLAVLSRMIRGVFQTVGQNPKVVWFEVAKESLTFALVAAVLSAHKGAGWVAGVYGIIAVFMLVWTSASAMNRFPQLIDLRIYRADRSTMAGLVGGGSIYLATVIANILLVHGTLIITNEAFGAATVALVATTRTLSNLVRQGAGAIHRSTLPEFSRLNAAQEKSSMEKLLRRSITFSSSASGAACIALVGIGPWLYDLWTGDRFPGAAPLIYLFVAGVMVDALRMPLHDFLLGCNKIARVSATNIIYAVCSLALMQLLFTPLGTWAVPIAVLVCGAVIHLPQMIIGTTRILGGEALFFLGRGPLINYPVLGLFVLGLKETEELFVGHGADIGLTAAAVALYGLFSWRFIFTKEDKRELLGFIRRNISARIQRVR